MTSFGYNTLGFGSFTSRGGTPFDITFLVIAGGAAGGHGSG